MNCAYLTDLATSIWNDLGQPTDYPVSYIQSKLVSNAFLGKLNAYTYNCFSGYSGTIVPELNIDEQAIYALMFESDWYTSKLNRLMAGNDLAWTTLNEGDSRITRVSAVDLGRLYRDMQGQLAQQLSRLISAYNKGVGTAQAVDYLNMGGPYWGVPPSQSGPNPN